MWNGPSQDSNTPPRRGIISVTPGSDRHSVALHEDIVFTELAVPTKCVPWV